MLHLYFSIGVNTPTPSLTCLWLTLSSLFKSSVWSHLQRAGDLWKPQFNSLSGTQSRSASRSGHCFHCFQRCLFFHLYTMLPKRQRQRNVVFKNTEPALHHTHALLWSNEPNIVILMSREQWQTASELQGLGLVCFNWVQKHRPACFRQRIRRAHFICLETRCGTWF